MIGDDHCFRGSVAVFVFFVLFVLFWCFVSFI